VEAKFVTPPVGCLPYTAVFDNTTIAGQTWLWDFGDGTTSTDFEPTHEYTLPGPYTITLTATNPNTCNQTSTYQFTINVYPKPAANFTWSPAPPIVNTPTNFSNISSPDAVQFKWKFGDGDSLMTTSTAPVQHQYNSTGTFNACLTAYNSIGCDSTVCMPVQAIVDPLVDVPNAFTPLSNDANSLIMVRGFGIGKVQFIIWNRWGQKVFESNSLESGWDGRYKGKPQEMDAYAYVLTATFIDGSSALKKGNITLLR
jgi:gliding motility-associated-like protein